MLSNPSSSAIRFTLDSSESMGFFLFSPLLRFRMFWILKADFCFPLRFPLSAYGLDKGLHPVCTVFLHLFGHMTVHIKGKSGSCVTQILLDSLHIVTGFEGNNGIRVAQIVKSHGRHPQFTDHQFEGPVQCLGCDACTELYINFFCCPIFFYTYSVILQNTCI